MARKAEHPNSSPSPGPARKPDLSGSSAKQPRSIAKGAHRKEETIGFLLWDATRLHRHLFQKHIVRHGVGIGHWPFLRELWEESGLTVGELAARARMRGPTTVSAVQWLEAKGLVTRQPSESDQRKTHIYLTDAGRDMYTKVVPGIDLVAKVANAGLTPEELELLKSFLRRIRDNVLAHDGTLDTGDD